METQTIEYKKMKGLPKEFNNNYFVSSRGDIFSTCYGRVARLATVLNPNGYRYISFIRRYKNGKLKSAFTTPVHRLVAATFLGKCPAGCEVHHIDNNKLNNDISNLKYVSRESNMIRGWVEGRFNKVSAAVKNKRQQQDGKNTSLTDDDVRQIRRLRDVLTNKEVGFIFNLHPMQISRIVNKRSFANVE